MCLLKLLANSANMQITRMGHSTEAKSNYVMETTSVFQFFPGNFQDWKNPCGFTINPNAQNITNYVQIGSI